MIIEDKEKCPSKLTIDEEYPEYDNLERSKEIDDWLEKVKAAGKREGNYNISCYQTNDDRWMVRLENDAPDGKAITFDLRWMSDALMRFEAMEKKLVGLAKGIAGAFDVIDDLKRCPKCNTVLGENQPRPEDGT